MSVSVEEADGFTLCLVQIESYDVFCGPQELVKDNSLPDNELIASFHIRLSLSTVMELASINEVCHTALHYVSSPKLNSFHSVSRLQKKKS